MVVGYHHFRKPPYKPTRIKGWHKSDLLVRCLETHIPQMVILMVMNPMVQSVKKSPTQQTKTAKTHAFCGQQQLVS